jgi:hypothetical protein
MLEGLKWAAPIGAAQVSEDIKNFYAHHPTLPVGASTDIRNAHYCHTGKIAWLEDMWAHVRSCEQCRSRINYLLSRELQ